MYVSILMYLLMTVQAPTGDLLMKLVHLRVSQQVKDCRRSSSRSLLVRWVPINGFQFMPSEVMAAVFLQLHTYKAY